VAESIEEAELPRTVEELEWARLLWEFEVEAGRTVEADELWWEELLWEELLLEAWLWEELVLEP
jgi:hypothetical protein